MQVLVISESEIFKKCVLSILDLPPPQLTKLKPAH